MLLPLKMRCSKHFLDCFRMLTETISNCWAKCFRAFCCRALCRRALRCRAFYCRACCHRAFCCTAFCRRAFCLRAFCRRAFCHRAFCCRAYCCRALCFDGVVLKGGGTADSNKSSQYTGFVLHEVSWWYTPGKHHQQGYLCVQVGEGGGGGVRTLLAGARAVITG